VKGKGCRGQGSGFRVQGARGKCKEQSAKSIAQNQTFYETINFGLY